MLNHSPVPLSDLICQAERMMRKLNYSDECIRRNITTWHQFIKYSEYSNVLVFDESIAASFLKERYNYPNLAVKRHSSFINSKANAIRRLSDLQQHGRFLAREKKKLMFITPEFKPSVNVFMDYCKKRNLVEDTLYKRQKKLNCFFEHMLLMGIQRPEDFTSQAISEYMITLTGYSRQTANEIASILRQYFKSLYLNNLINKDLSESIPKIHYPTQDKIPVVWDESNIEKLLQQVDRNSPIGKRDYALLLIVIHLGLRDGDVRELKFENIKWNANIIEFIQSKTSQSLSLPLLPEIGNAIIDYLKNGRPDSDSTNIFIKHTAPYDAMKKAGNVVTKYLRLAHIPVECDRQHGIHSLRHSLANRLLSQNVSLDIISGILGHATINSSKEYMHLDIDNLRRCALEVGEINDK